MFIHSTCAQRLSFLLFIVSTWTTLSAALDVEYCSNFNAAETPRNVSIYQTNGLCHDQCVEKYAYAITQKNSCWCSNYGPAKDVRESTGSCNTPCPAWPQEYCGGDGLYGYVLLGNVSPSGTRGPSPSSTQDATTAVISRITETVQNTVTFIPKESTETSTETSTLPSSSSSNNGKTTSSSTTSSSTTAPASSTTDAPAVSEIRTVTAGGTIRTVTLGAPDSTGTSAGEKAGVTTSSGGLGTGAVVGIVVGVIAAVVAAAAVALFFLQRKKQRREQDGFQDDPSVRGSSAGMMGPGRPEMSMMGSSPGSQNSASNRNSTLNVDPRMDPFKQGLYVRNASHESLNSLRDDHDYSRRIQPPKVLRATNPDHDV